MLLPLLKG